MVTSIMIDDDDDYGNACRLSEAGNNYCCVLCSGRAVRSPR